MEWWRHLLRFVYGVYCSVRNQRVAVRQCSVRSEQGTRLHSGTGSRTL